MDHEILNYSIRSATSKAFKKTSDAILLPQLIQLKSNIYMMAFRIMKLLPARHIIFEALKRGEITEKCTIVETSSGTYALGLGIICAELGLPFRIFGDPAIDQNLMQRLEDLGGTVHISQNPESPGAYQKLRLEALNNYISQEKLSYWTKQYDNLDNTRAYYSVGEMILKNIGKNVNIVGAVGSGGSTAGISKPLRDINPSIKVIGVDTFNSVLFGLPNGKRLLRGLGNTIMPKNIDHRCYDEIHWVSANDAHYYTRLLHKKYALYYGPTTGAAFQVSQYLANLHPNEMYIFTAPDEGHRYADTIYNNMWLKQQDYYSEIITEKPIKVKTPLDAKEPWAFINWDRRAYQQLVL